MYYYNFISSIPTQVSCLVQSSHPKRKERRNHDSSLQSKSLFYYLCVHVGWAPAQRSSVVSSPCGTRVKEQAKILCVLPKRNGINPIKLMPNDKQKSYYSCVSFSSPQALQLFCPRCCGPSNPCSIRLEVFWVIAQPNPFGTAVISKCCKASLGCVGGVPAFTPQETSCKILRSTPHGLGNPCVSQWDAQHLDGLEKIGQNTKYIK